MSGGSEVASKVPSLFRCAVPLVIRDAELFFHTDKSSVTGPQVNIQLVPESPAGVTFAVRATNHSDIVHFNLIVRATIDLELELDLCLRAQTPTGSTVHSYDTESKNLKLKKKQRSDETQITCFDFACVQENELFDGNLHLHADVSFEIISGLIPPMLLDLRSFAEKLRTEVHSDFTLIGADGLYVKTHKLVLESISPVFQAMFATDCQETREGCCQTPDFDGETLSAMLGCILGYDEGDMEFVLIAKLLKFADMYEMLPLKRKCAYQLARKLSVENVVEALLLGEELSVPKLKTAGFTFMENSWKEVIINNVGDALRNASPALYEEWQKRLASVESGGTSRKRAAVESSSDSPSTSKK